MLRAALASTALLLASGLALAQHAVTTGAGAFAVADPGDRSGQVELQFRPDAWLWIVQPMVGGFVNGEGGAFGYAGISAEIELDPNFFVRPSFAPGLYHRGDGRDLGGSLQFRTGLELGWKFENGLRLGFEVYHLSNAGLRDFNPGAESALLTFTLPFR